MNNLDAGFQAFSAGTTKAFTPEMVFSNSNGMSFGINGSTLTGSHNGLSSQSNQAVSAANGSYAFQTLSFSNANGMSFGTSAGSAITGSYTVPTVTNSSWTVSDNATSFTVARLAFSQSNGLTLSLSTAAGGSATVVGSYTVPTVTNSSWTVSNGATSGTVARLAFTNLNGVTLSLSTGAGGSHTIVGSHNGLTVQSNQQMTMFATGNTTQSSTGTNNASSLIFRGEGLASIGITGGSVVISVPAGAPSPVNFSAGTTSGNLGSVVFSNSNGVTFGLNGSTITASVASGGGATISVAEIADGGRITTCALWNNATYSNRPIFIPFRLGDNLASCDTVRILASRTGGTVLVATVFAGFYSLANSTSMNLISSTSTNFSVSTSAQFSGIRIYDITGLSGLSLSQGNYVMGLMMSMAATNSGGVNIMGGDGFVNAGFVLGGTNSTAATHSQSHLFPMWGVWNATSAAMPDAVAKSSISGGASQNSPDVYGIIGRI